ncbi:MAG: ABC transporter permease, partial [Rhodospirillaceae bacterium]|nr:ABC transporter permease [Rhodospirillaceae bacterium]
MAVFILKRLFMMAATMVVASALLFALMEFTPGNVASKTLGPYATQEQKDILYEK